MDLGGHTNPDALMVAQVNTVLFSYANLGFEVRTSCIVQAGHQFTSPPECRWVYRQKNSPFTFKDHLD
jgi:hypothetical protein